MTSSRVLYVFFLFLGHAQTAAPLEANSVDCGDVEFQPDPIPYVLIPAGSVDQWCSAMFAKFRCLPDSTRNGGLKIAYTVVENQVNFICSRREDYTRSQHCFLSTNIQQILRHRCFQVNTFECRAVFDVTNCANDVISRSDNCSWSETGYLTTLIHSYFEPLREMKQCDTDETSTTATPVTADATTIDRSPFPSSTTKLIEISQTSGSSREQTTTGIQSTSRDTSVIKSGTVPVRVESSTRPRANGSSGGAVVSWVFGVATATVVIGLP